MVSKVKQVRIVLKSGRKVVRRGPRTTLLTQSEVLRQMQLNPVNLIRTDSSRQPTSKFNIEQQKYKTTSGNQHRFTPSKYQQQIRQSEHQQQVKPSKHQQQIKPSEHQQQIKPPIQQHHNTTSNKRRKW